MEATKLSELPLIVQLIAGAGLFFGTAMIAIGGWVYPKIKSKLPSALQSAPPANEAVVLSAAIADSQSIKQLAGAIDRLVEYMKEGDEIAEIRHERLDEHMKDVVSGLRGLKACLRERTIV
ncbi:hypothetical protein [Sphingomonas phage Birtae]|nr:hypothetical protein [Sphingomonas phage Birtae]